MYAAIMVQAGACLGEHGMPVSPREEKYGDRGWETRLTQPWHDYFLKGRRWEDGFPRTGCVVIKKMDIFQFIECLILNVGASFYACLR